MSINTTTTVPIWQPTKSTRLGRAVDRIYHHGLHNDGSSSSGRRHKKKKTSFASENKRNFMEIITMCLAIINRLRSDLLYVKTVLGGVVNTKNYKRHMINKNAEGDTSSRL